MNKINGVDFEINRVDGRNSYITVGVKGGYLRKWYAEKQATNSIVTIDRASSIAFGVYVSNQIGNDCIFNIGKNGIYFTLSKEKIDILPSLMKAIYQHDEMDSLINITKKNTVKLYKNLFSIPYTRSILYLTEFTDIRKQFIANELAHSIENITIEEVCYYTDRFVNSSNSFVMMNGEFSDDEIDKVIKTTKHINNKGSSYIGAGIRTDHVVLQDNYLIQHAGCKSIQAEYFLFHNDNVSLYEKLAWLLVMNEIILNGTGRVSLDTYDASIIYNNPEIDSFNLAELEINDAVFEKALKTVVNKQIELCSNAKDLGIYKGELFFAGINIFEFLNLLHISKVNDFISFSNNLDVEIHNGAVVNIG